MAGFGSSRSEVFCKKRCSVKKGVLWNFTKFTGNTCARASFFNKVAGLRSATILKKRLWHRCFPVNFVKFPRTPFLQNTSGRLLLFFITYFLFTFSIIAWKLILSDKQIFDTRALLAQRHLRKQVCVFIFLYQNMLIKYFFKHLFSIKFFLDRKQKSSC